VIAPGTRTDTFAYRDNRGRSFDGGLGAVGLRSLEAGVASNVLYMLRLEAGWSRQAPAGMVAISIQELRGALDARASAVIDRAGAAEP
jgi:hypothetical protein